MGDPHRNEGSSAPAVTFPYLDVLTEVNRRIQADKERLRAQFPLIAQMEAQMEAMNALALKMLAEANALQQRLEPFNKHVFRFDDRFDDKAITARLNETLGNNSKFNQLLQNERDRELEARHQRLVEAQQAMMELPHTPTVLLTDDERDDRTSAENRLETAQREYEYSRAHAHDPLENQLRPGETAQLKYMLEHPEQWGTTGTFEVGRFQVEVNIDAPMPSGPLGEMSTGTTSESSSSTTQQTESSQGHGRSREMGVELGIDKDGPSGKVSGGDSTQSSSSHGRSDSTTTSTSSSTKQDTNSPGMAEKAHMYASVQLPTGQSVQVDLGQVQVARLTATKG